jgi:hypothetical protein
MSGQASSPLRGAIPAKPSSEAHDQQREEKQQLQQQQPQVSISATLSPSRQPPLSPRSPRSPRSPAAHQTQYSIEAEAETGPQTADSGDDGFDLESHYAASTSLSSSVRDYVFENNRRYHKFKEGRYLIPNDEPEQEREDMKHSMIVNLCEGALHMAPLGNPHRILDIGTGTGIWAVDSRSLRARRPCSGILLLSRLLWLLLLRVVAL